MARRVISYLACFYFDEAKTLFVELCCLFQIVDFKRDVNDSSHGSSSVAVRPLTRQGEVIQDFTLATINAGPARVRLYSNLTLNFEPLKVERFYRPITV